MARFAALAGLLILTACGHAGSGSSGAEMFMSAAAPEVLQAPSPQTEVAEVPRLGIDACKDVIAEQARRLGAIHVEAVSAGQPRRLRNGFTEAALDASIIYRQENLVQLREARVTCELDQDGKVVSLL
jgi:hypothetical protein